MSNALAVRGLLTALTNAITTAWEDVTDVLTAFPEHDEQLPYVVLDWGPVTTTFDGDGASMRRPLQVMTFVIYSVFVAPLGQSKATILLDRADALIAILQAGNRFGGADKPLVTEVDPLDSARLDGVAELRMVFTCQMAVDFN